MSDRIRAWKALKSFKLALIIGGLAGLLTAGLLHNHLVGNLEPRASLLVGVGVGAGLTLILTYVFDQASRLVGRVLRAAKKKDAKR